MGWCAASSFAALFPARNSRARQSPTSNGDEALGHFVAVGEFRCTTERRPRREPFAVDGHFPFDVVVVGVAGLTM